MIREQFIKIWRTCRKGYDETYWFFFTLTSGGIIGAYFGLVGPVAVVAALATYFVVGTLKARVKD